MRPGFLLALLFAGARGRLERVGRFLLAFLRCRDKRSPGSISATGCIFWIYYFYYYSFISSYFLGKFGGWWQSSRKGEREIGGVLVTAQLFLLSCKMNDIGFGQNNESIIVAISWFHFLGGDMGAYQLKDGFSN